MDHDIVETFAGVNLLPATIMIFAVIIYTILWVLSGLAAFVTAIVCFNYSGNTTNHWTGLLLSMIVGPLFWLYYSLQPEYCR